MTLVELLVAMVIGLGLTLAVTSMLITGENHKRTTTSTNDAEQTGAYAFNALDKVLRGAGSGFIQSAYGGDRGVLGCRLNVTTILPSTKPFPSPFGSFLGGAPVNLRVAPVLIGQKQSPDGLSDVIAVMGGSGAAGGVSRQITGSAGGNPLVLDNAVGFFANDLLLISQPNLTPVPNCLLEEVIPPIITPNLTLGGVYLTPGSAGTSLATLGTSTSSYVTPLGNAGSVANPGAYNLQFMLFGVDANHTLYSYDLLQNQHLVQSPNTPDAAQAIADDVYQINAIYGIATGIDGVQTAWAGPGDPNYDIATLMTNTNLMPNSSLTYMESIVSVRIGLVVRGEYFDKHIVNNVLTPVSPPTFTLFQGLTNAAGTPLQQTVPLNTAARTAAGDRQYRYRVFEFTVPLRNMILFLNGP
jgi:type IV pilus assembly protein PilW